jgi:hypothetical protein
MNDAIRPRRSGLSHGRGRDRHPRAPRISQAKCYAKLVLASADPSPRPMGQLPLSTPPGSSSSALGSAPLPRPVLLTKKVMLGACGGGCCARLVAAPNVITATDVGFEGSSTICKQLHAQRPSASPPAGLPPLRDNPVYPAERKGQLRGHRHASRGRRRNGSMAPKAAVEQIVRERRIRTAGTCSPF